MPRYSVELRRDGRIPAEHELMPLIKWLFDEPNPVALNTALAQLGVSRPGFRLPYVPLSHSQAGGVRQDGREYFVGEEDI
ncbi:hypothetical protein MLD38_017230 [Melastoma candidum]|uniref:Uncharacterized protein n=1 Tax=Melastoma candidum TaxID=119954 RepID=A0ACB9QU09_9MYRT|nr:hypothetical protein MLD38_017230 [Melastoma candidum]